MNLSDTKTNQEYIIEEINIDKCTKARLQVLGVLKGTKVRILNKRINPMTIVPYIIITSTLSCIIGLILDRLYYLVIRR